MYIYYIYIHSLRQYLYDYQYIKMINCFVDRIAALILNRLMNKVGAGVRVIMAITDAFKHLSMW